MAILNKQLKTAEAIYLEQNDLEKALNMYKSFHKWDEGTCSLLKCSWMSHNKLQVKVGVEIKRILGLSSLLLSPAIPKNIIILYIGI